MRVVVVALVVELFAVAAPVQRQWLASRVRYHADSGRPRYDVPLDHAALAAAGRILHRAGGTYYVFLPNGAPVLRGNVDGALGLWTPPALPLAASTGPTWVLSYRAGALVPRGLRVAHTYRLAPRIVLVRIAR